MVREGLDDYRYATALQQFAATRGAQAQRQAQDLLDEAASDITAHRQDHGRCEVWRERVAEMILSLQ